MPELRVLNKTTLYEPPLAVVAVKSTMVRNMTAFFQASGYTAARSISIRGLNPYDDYVIKLFYYLPSPSTREYRETVDIARRLIGAVQGRAYIWAGEAMLGLEAAVANSVKPGTKVLVVDNGVYGSGFTDLVKMYGGRPVVMGLDWRLPADPTAVDRWLEKERDVGVVTLVHCDTPSALYNPLRELAKVAADYGVLLIVDAVSSIGADEILFDQRRVGVLIGGSQRAFNAPPGLTILAVSEAALERAREVGRETFYMNYFVWEEWLRRGGFSYTMPDVLLYALKESLSKILEEGLSSVFQRHKAARLVARRAVETLGLEPLPSLGYTFGRNTGCYWPEAGGPWRAR